MEKCIMGAVTSVFPAFPGIWALPKHMLFSQTWETQFYFRHYLCSLSVRFLFKYPTLPDAMVTFTHNAARCCRRCRCWGWPLSALSLYISSKILEATLVFSTELVLSSVLAFDEVCLIKSCASAFSFNQSLKSRSVGFTQCFFTVKSDQDSFRLGGNLWRAVLRSEALLRSESYESDLKTPTRLEIVAE